MMLSLKSRKALTATFGGIVTTLSAGIAFAQAPTATPPTPAPATPAVPGPAAPEPGPAVGADVSVGVVPPAEPTPAPEPAVVAPEPAPEPAFEPVPTAEVPAAEEAAPEEATGGASLMVFADAWMGIQSAKSGYEPPAGAGTTGGDVYALKSADGVASSGFGLSWFGADVGYDGGAWAINSSLRFGDGVHIYGTGTLGPITQAFLTWRPADGLSISAGTFGTIYGAEVAESWNNLNYTRGEVYMNLQPFWHTGLKAEYSIPNFVFRALVVNDPNTSSLGSGAVNLGAQVGYESDIFSLYAGALQTLAPVTSANAGSGFGTFFDVVALLSVGDFSLIGNFDLNTGEEVTDFWGVSLAAGYAFHPQFGMALRGEILGTSEGYWGFDPDAGKDKESILTGTLTFDVKPVKDVDNFSIRLDTRVERTNEVAYTDFDGEEYVNAWYSAVLGIVGHADLL